MATTTTSTSSSFPTPVMGDGGSGFDDGEDWWAFPTAIVVKWTIIGALFVGFLALFWGGYLHAKRRMKKGKAPLGYHKFMVPQRQLMAFYMAHPDLPESQAYFRRHQRQQFAFAPPYGPSHSASAEAGLYPMGSYMGPPPPAYVRDDYVPAYTPREDDSNKVLPNQNYQGTTGAAVTREGQTTGVVPGAAATTRQEQAGGEATGSAGTTPEAGRS